LQGPQIPQVNPRQNWYCVAGGNEGERRHRLFRDGGDVAR
jgi:hypothetical protein